MCMQPSSWFSGSGTVYNANKDIVSVSDTGDIDELEWHSTCRSLLMVLQIIL